MLVVVVVVIVAVVIEVVVDVVIIIVVVPLMENWIRQMIYKWCNTEQDDECQTLKFNSNYFISKQWILYYITSGYINCIIIKKCK